MSMCSPRASRGRASSVAARPRRRRLGDGRARWQTGALDVRATLKTDDGAIIYTEYRGRVRFGADGLNQVFTSPRFETGDARYAWLNGIQCIGKGISNQHERWLRYRLYAVV